MTHTSKARRIRVGLIGGGQRGQQHLRSYQKIDGAEIVALADIAETQAQQVAAEFNIPHVYADYRDLIKHADVEAIDICLHNNLHRPATVAALEAGKPVYCEKPMAGSYADAKVMYDTAQATGLHLAIQLGTLFTKETRAAKTLIDAGQLGQIYHARSTGFRRRGRPYVDGYGAPPFVQKRHAAGGALYDMGIYHIAQLLYLIGNPAVTRISGQTYQKLAMNPEREKLSGYDVEELGLGFIRFNDDVTMDIIESWAIHLDNFEGSSVVGTLGGIRLRPFGFYHSVGDLDLSSTIDLDAAHFRWNTLHADGEAYEDSPRHWIAALQGRVKPLPTAELALNTMLISEGIYLSDKLGREVTAEEVIAQSQPSSIL